MFVLPLARSSSLARGSFSPSFDRLVDRLFDDSSERVIGTSKAPAAIRTPAMDVFESDTAYTVSFDVPGATRDALKVSVEGRRVTLSTAVAAVEPTADKKASEPAAEVPAADRPLYRERTTPVFARTVSLPAEVDQQASQARFENGVLTLVLTKKIATGATQLQIA